MAVPAVYFAHLIRPLVRSGAASFPCRADRLLQIVHSAVARAYCACLLILWIMHLPRIVLFGSFAHHCALLRCLSARQSFWRSSLESMQSARALASTSKWA